MTRLNKVKKLEERIAPSMFGFGGNIHFSSGVSGEVGGHPAAHVDSQAAANVDVSAGGGWVHPSLLMRALQQHGLLDASLSADALASIESSTHVKY